MIERFGVRSGRRQVQRQRQNQSRAQENKLFPEGLHKQGQAEQKGLAISTTSGRKTEHIRICLDEEVNAVGLTAGFEAYTFRHNALPEIDFDQISLRTTFLERQVRTPLLISSMTGGSETAGQINERLAEAAERRGWAMGVGSVRAAVEQADLARTFAVRRLAPTIPVIANLGAVQLNYGFGTEDCQRAVQIAEADMLVLHLNGLQEVFQPEGNTAFGGLLHRIEQLCRALPVPVGVKEVGWGIDDETAVRLYQAGVAFIDVAGAGGTSWSQVEKFRSGDPVRRMAAEAFAGWGIPTAECIRSVRGALPGCAIIGSGGLNTGVDAAKALALGADMAGYGRALLGPAVQSEQQLDDVLSRVEFELRTAMFGIGAADIISLKMTERLTRK